MSAFRDDLVLLPNLLSLSRILLICVGAVLLLCGHPILGLAVGIPAGLTDYLDGWLARRRNQVTELGALLDLLADVLFTLVCLTVAQLYKVWPTYLLIAWGFRDMSVMALRTRAGLQGMKIPSSFLSKVAANFNAYACVLMGLDIARPFADATLTSGIHWLGLFGIHAGIAMQWFTGAQYLRSFAAQYRRGCGPRA